MSWFIQTQFVMAYHRATFFVPSRHRALGGEVTFKDGNVGMNVHYAVDRFDELSVMKTLECIHVNGNPPVKVPDEPLEAFAVQRLDGGGSVVLAAFHVRPT